MELSDKRLVELLQRCGLPDGAFVCKGPPDAGLVGAALHVCKEKGLYIHSVIYDH